MENKSIPARDPVCGMMVDPSTVEFHASHDGAAYHFCSAGCRSKFLADPSRYTSRNVAPKIDATNVIYTCPMHPQIRQSGPGNCPICGMALEPLTATPEAGPNLELRDMTRRFWIALVLTLPVFALEMGSHLPALNLSRTISDTTSTWIQFGLSTPVILWAGWPFFSRGWASLRNHSLNMFTLIALGVCRTCASASRGSSRSAPPAP